MANTRKLRNRRKAEAERLRQRYNTILTFIALIVLTLAPLVFRMARISFVSPVITNTTTADTGEMSDVFTHYKSLIYYALSVVLLIIFSARLLTTEFDEFRLSRYDAAIAALCVFMLISCIASEYRVIAIQGFIYMLDGAAAHICYCVLFFFGYHVFSRSRYERWFLIPLIVSGLINALISVLNFSGVNMIDTAIVKSILGVPPGAVATNAKAFSSTFGNINYLSGFGGVLFAVFFSRLLFTPRILLPSAGAGFFSRVDRRALMHIAASLLMVAAAFSIIVTSTSSSGFFTFTVMAPIIIVIAFLCGDIKKKAVLAATALSICALILLPLAAIDDIVYEETFGMFGSFAINTPGDRQPAALPNEQQLGHTPDKQPTGSITINRQPAAAPVPLALAAAPSAAAAPAALAPLPIPLTAAAPAAPALLAFAAAPPGDAAYTTDFDLPDYFPKPGISPGTGRLYIWKDTLRLIMRKPLTGYGMDTLSYAFPQNDLEKVAGMGSYDIYITKPHNIYIAYAYGAGIPALLAFLLLNILGAAAFLRYFISRKKSREAPDLMIMCSLLGWAAYLVQAFVNDDLISTAPLWWTLLGVGLGLINASTETSVSPRT